MSNPFEKDMQKIVSMASCRPFMNLCGWYEDGELVFRYCDNRRAANDAARSGKVAFHLRGGKMAIILPATESAKH